MFAQDTVDIPLPPEVTSSLATKMRTDDQFRGQSPEMEKNASSSTDPRSETRTVDRVNPSDTFRMSWLSIIFRGRSFRWPERPERTSPLRIFFSSENKIPLSGKKENFFLFGEKKKKSLLLRIAYSFSYLKFDSPS